MLITKKESKKLRYFARANYKAEVKGVESDSGKVKHRVFPCFELVYDESKTTDGSLELTNVSIGGKPFEGDYEALMTRLREILDNPDRICIQELEQDRTLTEQVMAPVKEQSDAIVIAEKNEETLKKPINDVFPEENRIDAGMGVPNVVDHIDVQVDAKPVEVSKTHEKETNIVTVTVFPGHHDSGRDYSEVISGLEKDKPFADSDFAGKLTHLESPVLEEASVAESLEYPATHEPPPLEEPQELPMVENGEEAKMVVEETGKPVITTGQKPKKTRAELYDLQIKCATMRLATSYGEPPETDIGSLMKKYPDAVEKLNALYAADGIKTYTITEDAIKQAYPDEYAVLC